MEINTTSVKLQDDKSHGNQHDTWIKIDTVSGVSDVPKSQIGVTVLLPRQLKEPSKH